MATVGPEAVFQQVLTTDGGLASLVSDRIYPDYMPQNATLPCVTFMEVDGVPVRALGGYSGVTLSRVQVDVWADTKADMWDGFRYTRLALTDQTYNVAGIQTQQISLDNWFQQHEPPFDGRERMTRRVVMEFICPWFEEPL